ncbi:SNPC4 protein, partial [Alaudala cheleensis]|nr:SNPC4 protein [Alaudala cheleensis]
KEVEIEEDSSDDDDDIESLPQDPETCLQMNHVYQEVIREKIEEVEQLIAQNREEQKEIMCELEGSKKPKAGDGRNLLTNVFLGHFMKPYFKDKTTGIGPPSNEEAKEKAAQGIKCFEQLRSTKWKTAEKSLLQQSVVSDRLQRLLQPKLLKLSYWNQKLEKVKTETEKQLLEKQIKELEEEIEAINQLPESDLIGNRFDEHDWDKISNIHFDGQRSSEELRKFWQNWEHPSINKKEWTEKEIEMLKHVAAKHNYVDWETIAQELGTNRTAFQCLQKYQIYNKDLKRKEWTKDEDQMLLELVQEMRVGSHIPYKKIAYYMEGRDSAQLIYRWTKSVDPSLKKGPWTPEEDGMLMAAVKKYREKDWYKVKTEVPGRSDAQCRDRYLKALHWDVKKGKWSSEEEEQLIELVQKHGLGHWSKIASELPHRTGSQCMSKWKLMIGSKVLCYVTKKASEASKWDTEESCSSSGSDSEEDMELQMELEQELKNTPEEEEEPSTRIKGQCTVPSIDLWIPIRPDTQGEERSRMQSFLSAVGAGAGSSCSDIPRAAGDTGRAADNSSELSTLLSGIGEPHSTDVLVRNPAECGKYVLRLSLEGVRAILRNNTRFQRKLVSASSALSALMLSLLAQPPGEGAAVEQELQEVPERAQCQGRKRWRSLCLDRRLLMAVTPWVGNVLLPCTLQAGGIAFYQSKAAAVHERMKSVSLSSTPLFALLIKLFQIDTKGCMRTIKERRLRQLELLKANAKSSQQVLCDSSQACSQRNSQQGIPRSAVRRARALRGRGNATGASESQRQKPKTVSELLQEKRFRESQAKKAMKRPLLLVPQVMVSGPLVIQQPPQPIILSAAAGSNPAAAAWTDSQVQSSPVPTRTPAAGSASAPVPENHSSAVPEAGESPGCSQGTDLQSRKKLKEKASGPLSLSTPVSCELKSNGLQQRPVSLLPALVTPPAASPGIPNSILPFKWVVTPQGLLPSTVQPVVGVPQEMPAAAGTSQCQTTGTSNGNVSGLGGTPEPAAAKPPHPSRTETKGPNSQLGGVPLGNAADQPTVFLPVILGNPGGSSMAPDSSAAASPALFALVLPQTHPPGSTQGSDSQPVLGFPSMGRSSDSITTNRSSFNEGSLRPGAAARHSRVPRSSGAQARRHRAIASKRPSADVPPQPSTSRADNTLLDFSLISLEDERLVKEWLSGKQGVQVPPLQTRLPYLPPFLCTIKTLSKLLVQKAALEEQAASLLPSEANGDRGTGDVFHAIGELVEQKLGDSPAYLLLKARFLAAFTLPAVLATLPPPRVTTTLSACRKEDEESDDEQWQSENMSKE